jgi:hypothetical protein
MHLTGLSPEQISIRPSSEKPVQSAAGKVYQMFYTYAVVLFKGDFRKPPPAVYGRQFPVFPRL